MSIIGIIVVLVVIGVILWLVETQIPLAAPIKVILRVVVIVAVLLWLLEVFGLLGGGLVAPLRVK